MFFQSINLHIEILQNVQITKLGFHCKTYFDIFDKYCWILRIKTYQKLFHFLIFLYINDNILCMNKVWCWTCMEEIMKKLYICTIIGSSGRDCVLIISFQRLGFLKVIYSEWVSMTPQALYWKENLIQYWYNLIEFLSNLSI